MRVDVYFNLHKKLFSIRSREPETRGLVIAHSRSVTLLNPRAVVSEKGWQRLKNKIENSLFIVLTLRAAHYLLMVGNESPTR